MDERELVGLLYRADWARLSLAGSVCGAAGAVLSVFEPNETRDVSLDAVISRPPRLLTPETLDGDIAIDLAPGERFRLTSADGRWTGGCDGSRVWQRLPELPRGVTAEFRAKPQPPIAPLLSPAWLLTGHTLTVREPTTVCGRPGIQISAVRTGGDRLGGLVGPGEVSPTLRWHLDGTYERVVAVVDATLGFLLCCEFQYGDRDAAVTNFTGLTIGAETDPLTFTAPPGSILGDETAADDSGGGLLARSALEAAKLVAGLAAGGLGAAVRYGPKRQADPFSVATTEAEDPDFALPADEPLPGWVTDGADAGGTSVSDEVLQLLYRGGVTMIPFTATVHEWADGTALIAAVPPPARQAGFGGIGLFVDALLEQRTERADPATHTAAQIRFGGWEKYRTDRVIPAPGTSARRPDRAVVTNACDGSRWWRVYQDRVEVRPAMSLNDAATDLVDGSWLLRCRLSGGEQVVVDGRPGYQVIATARPGGVPLGLAHWLTGALLPAVAVVDAATGRLLRLTRYLGGEPVRRAELRSLSDGGPDDFGFTPPDGLRVVDKSGLADASRPEGRDAGRAGADAAKVADAVKKQVDDTVAAARGFLESFLGGPGGRG